MDGVIEYFQKEGLSYHFLIEKTGVVNLLVDPVKKAFFAGNSSWGNLVFLNTSAIGIGFLNSGFEEYPEDQIQGAAKLVAVLCKIYDIDPFITTSQNVNGLDVNFLSIIASGDASPGRAHDVGGYFPWKMFYSEFDKIGTKLDLKSCGLSTLFDEYPLDHLEQQDEILPSEIEARYYEETRELFELLGYRADIKSDIIQAFNRHFVPEKFRKESFTYNDNGVMVIKLEPKNAELSLLGLFRLRKISSLIKQNLTALK